MNAEDKIARVARGAHNALVIYNRLQGDYTLKEWEDAEGWQRESTIDMVKRILAGNYSAKAEHEAWLAGKLKKGYTLAAEKNDDASRGPLTNPLIMEYDKIPIAKRMNNHLQISVTIGLAAHYGLAVEKVPELTFA